VDAAFVKSLCPTWSIQSNTGSLHPLVLEKVEERWRFAGREQARPVSAQFAPAGTLRTQKSGRTKRNSEKEIRKR